MGARNVGGIPEFQSTPPRGWRPDGITFTDMGNGDFNPLHREGGDSRRRRGIPLMNNFNPLHREGGDAQMANLIYEMTDFNPLHREGGDEKGLLQRRN